MGKMIGIDLGTTNSCVAVMEGGVPQVIPNQEGARTTPSIVGFTAKGERLVGQIAKRQALTNPKNTVYAVKRLIGRKFDTPEADEARKFLPFQLVNAPNGDVHIQIEDKVYSPPEISSFVLQKLKAAAEDYLGESVEEAIITVPAYFNDPQRQATKDAGLVAGLKVSRIINEPTAAALAYGLKNTGKSGQFVAVYDLGGGTFDITILEMADGLFQVRATGGDTYLGGEDFDQRIINWLIGEFQRETGIDLTQDRMALQRLKEAAEKAKCELSTAQQTEIVLPFISADASGPKHLNTVLTRSRYEELTDELLERTIEPCRRCLADAGMKPEQIDEVLLVGGQTRAPKVTDVVRKLFAKEPNRAVNPDEGVAMGAAIQTGIIQGEVKDLVLLDVTPHTLGIETKDGTFTSLIERNSTIPTRKSRVFTTVADNQTRVEVHILQGESDMAAYNKSLAKFELTSIPPAPKGVPQIEVTFEIDVNGITSVNAQDQATGRSQNIVIHPSGGLSQAEVGRLVEETRARDSADKARKEQQAIVLQLDALVANTMRSVQTLDGRLAPDEQKRILDAIERAKKARSEGHTEDLAVFTPEEQELLLRLGGLIVNTKRSLRELDGRLEVEERERIIAVIERANEALSSGTLKELKSAKAGMEDAAAIIAQARLRLWRPRPPIPSPRPVSTDDEWLAQSLGSQGQIVRSLGSMKVMEIRWHGEVVGRFEPTECETLGPEGVKQRGRMVWFDFPAARDLLARLSAADRRLEEAGVVEVDRPGPHIRAFLSLISPSTGEALLYRQVESRPPVSERSLMAEGRVANALVEQFRLGGVPRAVRLMAAQGLLPLNPVDLLEMWTDLVQDPDEGVRSAADKSLSSFPAAELQPILKSRDTPASVLSWAVTRRPEHELREVALQNTSLPDETIEALAPVLTQALAELVVANQTRLLRRTSLLVALESSAGLNNDQKRRLRELRDSFRIGQAEAVLPPATVAPPTPQEAPPEPEPEPEVAPVDHVSMTEDEALVRNLSEEERQQPEKVSTVLRVYRLNTAEKLITALKGSHEERAILIRDPSRLVATAVLGSPRLTDPEIEAISAMEGVSAEILRKISHHREWTKRYAVCKNLVRNRRTPIDIVLRLRTRLSPRDTFFDRDTSERVGDRFRPFTVIDKARGRKPPTLTRPSDAHAFENGPGFSREEQELLARVSGLFVQVNRSFGALGSNLKAEQREEIEASLDRARAALHEGRRDELGACVRELVRAIRLLEEASGTSRADSQQPSSAAPEPETARRESTSSPVARPATGSWPASTGGWSPASVDLYRALVRARLAEAHCHRCGAPLESALLPQVRTSVGLLLNELQLSDLAAARLLAHTDDLVFECQDCGARNEVRSPGELPPVEAPVDRAVSRADSQQPSNAAPESGTPRPESSSSHAASPTLGSRPASTGGWSPGAVELYRALVRARLVGAHCNRCGASLESDQLPQVRTTVGLLLNEFGFGDLAAARLLAHSDELVVECQDCGTRNEVRSPGELPPVEAPVDRSVSRADSQQPSNAAPESGTPRPESSSSHAASPTLGSRPASTGGWSPGAVELYRALVRARLVGAHCHRCGASFESALPQVRTSVGLLLNEFQLGDLAAARLLAHTDALVVECKDCGARNQVGAPSAGWLGRLARACLGVVGRAFRRRSGR